MTRADRWNVLVLTLGLGSLLWALCYPTLQWWALPTGLLSLVAMAAAE